MCKKDHAAAPTTSLPRPTLPPPLSHTPAPKRTPPRHGGRHLAGPSLVGERLPVCVSLRIAHFLARFHQGGPFATSYLTALPPLTAPVDCLPCPGPKEKAREASAMFQSIDNVPPPPATLSAAVSAFPYPPPVHDPGSLMLLACLLCRRPVS
jgi:hypothetical protein